MPSWERVAALKMSEMMSSEAGFDCAEREDDVLGFESFELKEEVDGRFRELDADSASVGFSLFEGSSHFVPRKKAPTNPTAHGPWVFKSLKFIVEE